MGILKKWYFLAVFPHFFRNETSQRGEVFCVAIITSKRFIYAINWPSRMIFIFKASALWADASYKSKCPSVCPSVRPCVCSLLRYRLTVFLLPLPEVGCPIYLEIRNPWGKVMERSGLRFEFFFWKWYKTAAQFFFFFLLILPSKTWWKPCFPMD